ncbi:MULTISPECIES: oxygen-independent coproporphyrinogen III oxidase [Bradyrhizobium]|jgi:oxygen-independent coproporphyrinogen III oxidase|uniref:Coproporphyrinogen-III oxidase n=1 Tax=Bradyrhizobium elkanii TaxID=29448 RepID=A0ABV4EUK2_BRAEL|nr:MULTISPECIES: oxygen-independent coproporphyrinogen III oxidase [Bradyrhizobium]MDH6693835.1 oxygen-independent coproporphyrinogen-3 oxidase [Bradyrhizobium elkanii]MDI2059976.1 oxygen-independent coproporphyrinogen III oxidase [Bradyrhizobium sp. Mp19]MDI2109849.1 oxygen-independent coproporphyrinogen III oxidase [Bradyrhizobium sp. Mp64]NLS73218.1 oxygen-independent coproporphyrinogen III oxidase [Bradyrhizobium brasilense]NWL43185.1 oxygen-independent coproporphyrinogen III oxidase [Brad
MRPDLAQAYGQQRLPRYTSYPTAPHFSASICESDYQMWLKSLGAQQSASIYVHVPFCRRTCWYCGCHTSVTKRQEPISFYAAGLRTEAYLVAETLGRRQPITHIHFGGGTPTIMTPETFADLVGSLRHSFAVLPDAEIAVEIDPRMLSEPMAEALGYCGVNRASLGVQSFDPVVQQGINRLQSFGQTATSVDRLRRAGVERINFDLLYGLPRQTVASCLDTVARCLELHPDRFSAFGYAHIPSFKKHQRLIDASTLPDSIARHVQSETITEALVDAGYVRVGIDHFALPDDNLALASQEGRLRRNFQGYTDDSADTLIGLGASAIGRMQQGFVANAVPTKDYLARISEDRLAIAKGYLLTDDDRFHAEIIERIMCDLTVDLSETSRRYGRDPSLAVVDRSRLDGLIADGVVVMDDSRLSIAGGAEFLARSVASIFDAHLTRSGATHSLAV